MAFDLSCAALEDLSEQLPYEGHDTRIHKNSTLNPVSALEILEGQVATVHHIMAFETANPSIHVLYLRQVWKANFIAYFLGAVTKSQLVVMQQLDSWGIQATPRSRPSKSELLAGKD